jgi:hypothetical protein
VQLAWAVIHLWLLSARYSFCVIARLTVVAHACVQTQAQELADYFLSLPEDERPTAIFSSGFCASAITFVPVPTHGLNNIL